MELWAGGYKYKEGADKVAEMLKEHDVKVTVEPSKKGKYPYPAWDVLVEGTRADAYRKLSGKTEAKAEAEAKLAGKKAEIPPDALGLNWGTLTKVELWAKAKELGIIDELPPYAKATKKEIAEAVELKEKE